VVALSDRVAAATGTTTVVPATLPMPADALALRDDPVALMLADWSWPVNGAALRDLLAAWPAVRAEVPGAQLVVAGRGSPDVGAVSGVRVIGTVATTLDAMAEAAVLAFPAPATSGPKMKVLDALGAGLPVVTTTSGVEGLAVPADAVAVAADTQAFVGVMVDVLRDPARRARMADMARGAMLAHHAPAVAARARVAALVSR
jgi:glycosyltransferase involved in cell wall biosynthesis